MTDTDVTNSPAAVKRKRRNVPPKKRYAVLQRDGFKCRYCGAHAPGVVLEVDHITPVSAGGGNELTNLVTACRECNGGKRASLPGLGVRPHTKLWSSGRLIQTDDPSIPEPVRKMFRLSELDRPVPSVVVGALLDGLGDMGFDDVFHCWDLAKCDAYEIVCQSRAEKGSDRFWAKYNRVLKRLLLGDLELMRVTFSIVDECDE